MRTVLPLLVALLASSSPLLGQKPLPSLRTPTEASPVVTLGSMALTPTVLDCRAAVFSDDSKNLIVFTGSGWEQFTLASGTRTRQWNSQGVNFNDQIVPVSDGKHAIHVRREENKKSWPILSLATGKPTKTLELESISGGYAITEDGRYIAACGNTILRLYSVLTDAKPVEIEGITDVRRCSVSQDGKTFAVIADDRVVVVVEGKKWELPLPKDTAYITVAVSPDGTHLATTHATETDNGKRPGPVELWDIRERKKLRAMEKVEWFAEVPHRLRFTPDGRQLLAGDGAFVRGWIISTGAKTFSVEPGWGWVGNIQISPDGKLVSVAYQARPMVWNLETGRQPDALLGHTGTVWDIQISPDGTRAATAMYGRPTVYLWDTKTGRNLGEVNAAFAIPADGSRTVSGKVSVQFSLDGRQLLTNNEASGANGPIRVWDLQTRGLLREVPVPGRHGSPATLTPHGLFTVLDRKPMLLEVITGKTIWEKPSNTRIGTMVVSPQRDLVALEGVGVWSIPDGKPLDEFTNLPLAFTQDGSRVILSKGDRTTLRDWRAKRDDTTTQKLPKFEFAAVSRTGLLARQNPTEVYRTFDISRGDTDTSVSRSEEVRFVRETPIGMLEDQSPSSCFFSPDGRTFVAFRQGFRVFESYSGQELFSVGNRGAVRAIEFSPDGRTMWCSHESKLAEGGIGSTQVEGWDLTGGTGEPTTPGSNLDTLKFALNGPPPAARRAMYQLAARPAEAIAFVKEITRSPTKEDYAQYDTWMEELDAPAYAIREAATKGLAKAGWRVEGALQLLLTTTSSVEVRHRLEKLVRQRDMRPLRAVHLLEVIGTPEAIEVLREVAKGPTQSLVAQDARWALQRLTKTK